MAKKLDVEDKVDIASLKGDMKRIEELMRVNHAQTIKEIQGTQHRQDKTNGQVTRHSELIDDLVDKQRDYVTKTDFQNFKESLKTDEKNIIVQERRDKVSFRNTTIIAIVSFLSAWAGTGFKSPWW